MLITDATRVAVLNDHNYLRALTSARLLRRATTECKQSSTNSAAQLIRVVQAQGSDTTTDSPAQASRASAPSRFDSGALQTNSNRQSSTAIRRPPSLHSLRQHAVAHHSRPCSPFNSKPCCNPGHFYFSRPSLVCHSSNRNAQLSSVPLRHHSTLPKSGHSGPAGFVWADIRPLRSAALLFCTRFRTSMKHDDSTATLHIDCSSDASRSDKCKSASRNFSFAPCQEVCCDPK